MLHVLTSYCNMMTLYDTDGGLATLALPVMSYHVKKE